METLNTPIANRIIDRIIYGTRENYKKPLESTLKNPEERTKRFNEILEMKTSIVRKECDCGTRDGFAHCITCAVNK